MNAISPEQTLLQNNASARFFNAKLSGTDWRVEDVSSFLSKASEDTRPRGSAYTWREVFNETDQAIQTISRFMEVHLYTLVLITQTQRSDVTGLFIIIDLTDNVSGYVDILWSLLIN